MIKQLVLVVVAILLIVAGTAAARPRHFRVERSIMIKAPPERIFPLVNDFRNFDSWSPLAARDPSLQRGLSGAPNGKGAAYDWSGTAKVGAGRMEILESTPASRVLVRLDVRRPWTGQDTMQYTLRAIGDSTKVTWALFGQRMFFARLVGVYYTMDDLLGGPFETGLRRMKRAAEQVPGDRAVTAPAGETVRPDPSATPRVVRRSAGP